MSIYPIPRYETFHSSAFLFLLLFSVAVYILMLIAIFSIQINNNLALSVTGAGGALHVAGIVERGRRRVWCGTPLFTSHRPRHHTHKGKGGNGNRGEEREHGESLRASGPVGRPIQRARDSARLRLRGS